MSPSPYDDAPAPAPIYLPLPYEARLDPRPLAQIDLLVVHCTELPDLAMAREYGEQVRYAAGTGNSGHYYIDRDGRTQCWVAPERTAHHVRGYNPRSIGVELVNTGRYPNWLDWDHQAMDEAYPVAQVEALVDLIGQLQQQLPALAFITGHEALDTERVPASNDPGRTVPRKRDPGPRFPWDQVLAAIRLKRLPTP
jgi:N-acetylmuramoyl-L-alanine amidase